MKQIFENDFDFFKSFELQENGMLKSINQENKIIDFNIIKTVAGIKEYYNKVFGPGSYAKIPVSKKSKESKEKIDINVSPEQKPEYLSAEEHERYSKAKKKLARFAGTTTHYGRGIVSQVKEKLNKKEEYMEGKNYVHRAMSKFKRGQLHSGSKTGPIVQKRDQAIAIGLSEQRRKK